VMAGRAEGVSAVDSWRLIGEHALFTPQLSGPLRRHVPPSTGRPQAAGPGRGRVMACPTRGGVVSAGLRAARGFAFVPALPGRVRPP
jgi:hypothetical protein